MGGNGLKRETDRYIGSIVWMDYYKGEIKFWRSQGDKAWSIKPGSLTHLTEELSYKLSVKKYVGICR